jgi:hypothetical protein
MLDLVSWFQQWALCGLGVAASPDELARVLDGRL